MQTTALPAEVALPVRQFFANPLKPDKAGELHDIRKSSLRLDEALELARLVVAINPEASFEIGMAAAGSCVAIAAARRYFGRGNPHVVLDPFQETLTRGAGLLELDRLGLQRQIEWHPLRSEAFLQERIGGPFFADFVFVDGGHSIGQKVTDAFLLNQVLRPGGTVAFHDALLFSTSAAVRYLVQECGYSPIHLSTGEPLIRIFRCLRYKLRLGGWYATAVMPHLCRSLVALKKPNAQ